MKSSSVDRAADIGCEREERFFNDTCGVVSRGGGGSGGGSFVGSVDEPIILDSSLSWDDSSASSLALGMISERNSISSDDNARGLWVFVPDDLTRENRLKKRETADGLWTGSEISTGCKDAGEG